MRKRHSPWFHAQYGIEPLQPLESANARDLSDVGERTISRREPTTRHVPCALGPERSRNVVGVAPIEKRIDHRVARGFDDTQPAKKCTKHLTVGMIGIDATSSRTDAQIAVRFSHHGSREYCCVEAGPSREPARSEEHTSELQSPCNLV